MIVTVATSEVMRGGYDVDVVSQEREFSRMDLVHPVYISRKTSFKLVIRCHLTFRTPHFNQDIFSKGHLNSQDTVIHQDTNREE